MYIFVDVCVLYICDLYSNEHRSCYSDRCSAQILYVCENYSWSQGHSYSTYVCILFPCIGQDMLPSTYVAILA